MIIVFFTGLIIMASAENVSEICNIIYLQLVCNIIGGIMMGGSAFFFFKEEERKRSELKSLVEKLSGKEEHKNEISVLNSIVKVLQENHEALRIIEENQVRIIEGVCDKSEIKDSITAMNGLLKDSFDSLEKQVETQNTKVATLITEKISNLIDSVETKIQNISNAVENAEKSIKDESAKLNNAVNVLHTDNTDFRSQEENTIIDTLRCIEQRIEGVNKLPGEIEESVESLFTKFKETVDVIQGNYRQLTEDIEEQEKKSIQGQKKIMDEICNSSKDTNEEMTAEIKKLAEQYVSFEKMMTAIVEQMSHMAEEDIKVMKGFLNG